MFTVYSIRVDLYRNACRAGEFGLRVVVSHATWQVFVFFFPPAVFDGQHSCQACESVCVRLRVFTVVECFPYACACLSLYARPR